MITDNEIILAGKFNKPHGINGEISATLDIDIDMNDVKCIVTDIEGLHVPFFIERVRPKSAETLLLTIDGIDNEVKAVALSHHPIYLLRADAGEIDDDDEDGFYASDLIGYIIVDDDGKRVGEIVNFNDSTENILFMVETEDGDEIYIPVADEFIDAVDTEAKIITMSLPEGLTNL